MSSDLTSYSEMPLTNLSKLQWLTLWWGFFWRAMITMIVTLFASTFLGFALGLLAAIIALPLKLSKEYWLIPLQVISGALGFVLGIVGFAIFLKWLFLGRFFGYRFALMCATDTNHLANLLQTESATQELSATEEGT